MTEKKLRNTLCRNAALPALIILLIDILLIVLAAALPFDEHLFYIPAAALAVPLLCLIPFAITELTKGRKTYKSYAERGMLGELVEDFNRDSTIIIGKTAVGTSYVFLLDRGQIFPIRDAERITTSTVRTRYGGKYTSFFLVYKGREYYLGTDSNCSRSRKLSAIRRRIKRRA